MLHVQCIPVINIIEYTIGFTLGICRDLDVLDNPRHNMVLKGTFDQLVQEIWRQELRDVGTREERSEWLSRLVSCCRKSRFLKRRSTHLNIIVDSEHIPKILRDICIL